MTEARQTQFRPELVHPTAFIAAGAVVIGDVTLAENSSIWFNAVVRGDTTAVVVGLGTNVQDLCVLHADPGFPCILGTGVTVGHSAIVHGAVVEDNVVIGMRAVVMNGAKIGANSIVGAGAVVTAGTQIPAGSLVLGFPAKVRRPLTPAEISRNKETAQHYIDAAREYALGKLAAAEAPAPPLDEVGP